MIAGHLLVLASGHYLIKGLAICKASKKPHFSMNCQVCIRWLIVVALPDSSPSCLQGQSDVYATAPGMERFV